MTFPPVWGTLRPMNTLDDHKRCHSGKVPYTYEDLLADYREFKGSVFARHVFKTLYYLLGVEWQPHYQDDELMLRLHLGCGC